MKLLLSGIIFEGYFIGVYVNSSQETTETQLLLTEFNMTNYVEPTNRFAYNIEW